MTQHNILAINHLRGRMNTLRARYEVQRRFLGSVNQAAKLLSPDRAGEWKGKAFADLNRTRASLKRVIRVLEKELARYQESRPLGLGDSFEVRPRSTQARPAVGYLWLDGHPSFSASPVQSPVTN